MQVRIRPTRSQPSFPQHDASFSLDLDEEANAVETAVQKVLTAGYRTGDIMSEGCTLVGTKEMGDLIAKEI